ncbi:MAG: hypothetical protein IPO33_18825 [Saprospiraceae bacterium]|nr:hypothetical protein [Candidatus Brachybacter algidus]
MGHPGHGVSPLVAVTIYIFEEAIHFGERFIFQHTTTSRITFDAYGSGADPIIKGSEVVTGWTQHSGNIWKATISSPVHMLFVDGITQQLARYPNSGVLNTTVATTKVHQAHRFEVRV